MTRATGAASINAGRFLMGLAMLIAGGYLFFDNIQVAQHFSFHSSLYQVGGVRITSGMTLIPFLFGVGMIFYNPDNDLGWILVIATLVMIAVGVITSVQFHLRPMSVFELLMILGLALGGLGLLLSALRGSSRSTSSSKS